MSCNTYLLPYSRSRALLEEPLNVQPLKNFSAFHGTRRFNAVFTKVLHYFLSWDISIQSTTFHPASLRSILILSTHIRLCLAIGLANILMQSRPEKEALASISQRCRARKCFSIGILLFIGLLQLSRLRSRVQTTFWLFLPKWLHGDSLKLT
jgi:hypothetical protein